MSTNRCVFIKKEVDILSVNKITIGHGLPRYGQMDFISLIREEISMKTGEILWGTYIWGYGFWRF